MKENQRNSIVMLGIIFITLFYIFYVMYLFSIRPIVTGDEFINILRTLKGFAPGNIIDYSLRPLYRIITMTLVHFFGNKLFILQLSSLIFVFLISAILFYYTYRLTSNLLISTSSFFLLIWSPEFLRIGLGSLPQIYAGFFSFLAIILFMQKIAYISKHKIDQNHFCLLGIVSYILLYAAFLSHPVQVLLLIFIILADFFVLVILFINRNVNKYKYLKTYIYSLSTLIASIMVTDILYRIFGDGLQRGVYHLSENEPYSFIMMWYKALTATNPHIPSYYYHENYLFFLNHVLETNASFLYFFILILLLAIVKFVFSQNKIMYLHFFVPVCASLFVLFGLSITKFKAYYVLAQYAPLFTISIIFMIVLLFKSIQRVYYKNTFLSIFFIISALFSISYSYNEIQTKSHPTNPAYQYLGNNPINRLIFIQDVYKFNKQCLYLSVALDLKNFNYNEIESIYKDDYFCFVNDNLTEKYLKKHSIMTAHELHPVLHGDGHGIHLYKTGKPNKKFNLEIEAIKNIPLPFILPPEVIHAENIPTNESTSSNNWVTAGTRGEIILSGVEDDPGVMRLVAGKSGKEYGGREGHVLLLRPVEKHERGLPPVPQAQFVRFGLDLRTENLETSGRVRLRLDAITPSGWKHAIVQRWIKLSNKWNRQEIILKLVDEYLAVEPKIAWEPAVEGGTVELRNAELDWLQITY